MPHQQCTASRLPHMPHLSHAIPVMCVQKLLSAPNQAFPYLQSLYPGMAVAAAVHNNLWVHALVWSAEGGAWPSTYAMCQCKHAAHDMQAKMTKQLLVSQACACCIHSSLPCPALPAGPRQALKTPHKPQRAHSSKRAPARRPSCHLLLPPHTPRSLRRPRNSSTPHPHPQPLLKSEWLWV